MRLVTCAILRIILKTRTWMAQPSIVRLLENGLEAAIAKAMERGNENLISSIPIA